MWSVALCGRCKATPVNEREDNMNSVFLFSVNADTPPIQTINPGEEVFLVVCRAFADVKDISAIPTLFTLACGGYPLAHLAGPIGIKGAEPGGGIDFEHATYTVLYT